MTAKRQLDWVLLFVVLLIIFAGALMIRDAEGSRPPSTTLTHDLDQATRVRLNEMEWNAKLKYIQGHYRDAADQLMVAMAICQSQRPPCDPIPKPIPAHRRRKR